MEHISKFLRAQRDSKEDTDFEIIVENEEGKVHKKVHKFILRQCPYFAGLFRMNGQEAQKNSVELPSIREESMDLILDYLYGIEPTLTRENALDVARAANYLQLNELKIHAVNAYFKTYEKSRCNWVAIGLQAVNEFEPMLAPGERLNCTKLIETLLIYTHEWTNFDKIPLVVLATMMSRKRIPTVLFYILNEWHKLTKPKPEELNDLIDLYFKDNTNTDLPPLAIAMLAKLEIMNKSILSKFNSSDKLVARGTESMNCKMSSNRWGTFQLEDKALCMFHFTGFDEEKSESGSYNLFNLVPLRIVDTVTIIIELRNNKDIKICSWKRTFENATQRLLGLASLFSWRVFQQEVLDLTDPKERWCSLDFKLFTPKVDELNRAIEELRLHQQ